MISKTDCALSIGDPLHWSCQHLHFQGFYRALNWFQQTGLQDQHLNLKLIITVHSNVVALAIWETIWFKLSNQNISAMSIDFQQQKLTYVRSMTTICKGIHVSWHQAIGKVSLLTKKDWRSHVRTYGKNLPHIGLWLIYLKFTVQDGLRFFYAYSSIS